MKYKGVIKSTLFARMCQILAIAIFNFDSLANIDRRTTDDRLLEKSLKYSAKVRYSKIEYKLLLLL